MEVHFSSKTNEWYTPDYIFNYLNDIYQFTLDPCCTLESAKCDKFYTQNDNGLSKDWSNDIVFCNPPYGREISQWVEKAKNESLKGSTVVMLIPARTDTSYWHDFIFPFASSITFLKGRIKFGNSENDAPFPSAVIVFNGKSLPLFLDIEKQR